MLRVMLTRALKTRVTEFTCTREIHVYPKYISIFTMVKLVILCYTLEVLIKY
jgi:hypothetical protein